MMEPLETSTTLSFHGVAYVVTVTVRNQTLDLQVEVDEKPSSASPSSAQSSDLPACWTAQFPAAYVEDLTRKTGNYKRFPVFVNMLLSAMTHRSDAVFIDLLTTADLELYRKRKLGRQGQRLNDSFESFSADKSTAATQNASKRYLILTYAVEFDRVHYPLPLTLVEKPTIEILQRTIRRLRQAIAQATEGGKAKLMDDEMRALREENRCLKATLKTYCDREEADENAPMNANTRAPPASGIDLQHELELSMKENKELISIYQQLRQDSSAEMTRLRAEIKQLKMAGAESNDVERERLDTRRRLNDSNAAAHEALLQLQEMKLKMDEVQLKNRELQRQLAIARAKAATHSNGQQPARTNRTPPANGTSRERVQPQRGLRRSHTREYVDSSDEDDAGSQGYRSAGGTARRSFRRFDPTAYEEERQRKLQQRSGRGASPSRRPPTNGYTSDSSAGGYSSAGSDASKTSRGRSRAGYQQQRQADARLASPRREPGPPPSPRTAKPPPAPTRGRSPSPARSQNGGPPRASTPDHTVRRPVARPGSTAVNGKPVNTKQPQRTTASLLADTSLDSFSDIDDRLTALQQFLKEAKQGTSMK